MISNQSKVQATEVTYELHTLGWKAFQNLCATITSEVWGQTVQSFFDSHDAGRDGAFHGKWKTGEGELIEGSFTVQCKFTAKAEKQLGISDLSDEITKAKLLAARGLSDNYFLFTNAKLTGTSEQKLGEVFRNDAGIKHFAAYGVERISLIIRESPRLRMLVPRIYGLGDLSQILDERAQQQAREILSALGDDLSKFVITNAYQRSAKALVEHGFVLILGEPASGKSTIAASLAVGALDEWGCTTFKVRNADDFYAHWNPHEPKQFFWVDDAFGATQFEWSSAAAWNRVFPHIHAAIRKGARVLFTSRDYIYRYARQHLKESALPIIQESQVVIHVEQLGKEEREQILYNHVRLGRQPQAFKTQVKSSLPDVAAHTRFSPEIARRLGDPLFTKKLVLSKGGLETFVAHPIELLCEIVRTIDSGSRSALALIFMRGGNLPSPVRTTAEEERALLLMGGSPSDVRTALMALNGSLVLQTIQEGTYSWRFKHPTVRDAFAIVIAEDRELMDIYLAGTPIDRLFDEVTCGSMEIEGVKVIVPADRYMFLINRLTSANWTESQNTRLLHNFLAYRCDREFLARYIEENRGFVEGLTVRSYLNEIPSIFIMAKLHEFELLPESKRLSVAASIRDLAIETPDVGFLSEEIRKLLTYEELETILTDVRLKLLPNLSDTIWQWRDNFDRRSGEEPDNHFDDLISALNAFKAALAGYPQAITQIISGLNDIEEVIEELRSEVPEQQDHREYRGQRSALGFDDGSRSVFDDVDQ